MRSKWPLKVSWVAADPPLTKTSVTHVSKLVSTCVSTFWIHNFIINNPTKSYSQQTCTHSSNLTQSSRTHKSSTGGRKEKHLRPTLCPQKPMLRLKWHLTSHWTAHGEPYQPLIPNIGSTTIKINYQGKLSFSLFTNNSRRSKLVWQRTY